MDNAILDFCKVLQNNTKKVVDNVDIENNNIELIPITKIHINDIIVFKTWNRNVIYFIKYLDEYLYFTPLLLQGNIATPTTSYDIFRIFAVGSGEDTYKITSNIINLNPCKVKGKIIIKI